MRPAIYGYMRVVVDDLSYGGTAHITRELSEYTSCEGFRLDSVFAERAGRCKPAFATMLDALGRDGVRDVMEAGAVQEQRR